MLHSSNDLRKTLHLFTILSFLLLTASVQITIQVQILNLSYFPLHLTLHEYLKLKFREATRLIESKVLDYFRKLVAAIEAMFGLVS